MVMEVEKNNLISKAVTTVKQNGTKPSETVKLETKPDTFERSNKPSSTKISKSEILKGVFTAAFCLGLFFIPDIVMAFKNRQNTNLINKYRNFKPMIGDTITAQRLERLPNGKQKVTMENIKGAFKFNEIVIIDKKGKLTNRILIKKEELPNGKHILRRMKSYKGENLIDNNEIKKNANKYLMKEYKRSKTCNHQSKISIYRKGNILEENTYYSTPAGETTLIIKKDGDTKKNILFLYDKNKCIGSDTQIIGEKGQHNILNIPSKNIKNKKYIFEKDGVQYDDKLLEKFKQYF